MMKQQKNRPQHDKKKKIKVAGETPRWGTLSNNDHANAHKPYQNDRTLYVGNLDKRVTE
jgi:RNA recognition motif-containing protein